jgi:hypothetical protein
MFKWISDLQNKPEGYRRSVAVSVSIGFILVIIAVWLSTLFSGNFWGDNSEDEGGLSLEEVSAPIESLGSSFVSAVGSLKSVFEGYTEEPKSP